MVLSTVFVVPIAQALDATHRHSLTDALSQAVTGDSIVVFDSTGTAAQDVASAIAVYDRAREAGVGETVDFLAP